MSTPQTPPHSAESRCPWQQVFARVQHDEHRESAGILALLASVFGAAALPGASSWR